MSHRIEIEDLEGYSCNYRSKATGSGDGDKIQQTRNFVFGDNERIFKNEFHRAG